MKIVLNIKDEYLGSIKYIILGFSIIL